MEEQNNNGQLQIELREEVAQGTYANLAIITPSSSEFLFSFGGGMGGRRGGGGRILSFVYPQNTPRVVGGEKKKIIKR